MKKILAKILILCIIMMNTPVIVFAEQVNKYFNTDKVSRNAENIDSIEKENVDDEKDEVFNTVEIDESSFKFDKYINNSYNKSASEYFKEIEQKFIEKKLDKEYFKELRKYGFKAEDIIKANQLAAVSEYGTAEILSRKNKNASDKDFYKEWERIALDLGIDLKEVLVKLGVSENHVDSMGKGTKYLNEGMEYITCQFVSGKENKLYNKMNQYENKFKFNLNAKKEEIISASYVENHEGWVNSRDILDIAYSKAIYKPVEGVPFQISDNLNESINPVTGELTVSYTDLYLKGKNDLDFDLTRYYRLSESGFHEISSGSYLTYNDNHFNIGTGWALDIPFIEFKENSQVLHFGSKGVYYFQYDTENDGNYKFEEIILYDKNGNEKTIDRIKDIQFSIDENEYPGDNGETKAWLVLKEKSGKKYCFNEEGYLVAIKDKYDNTIHFRYQTIIDSDTNVEFTLLKKITDSVGRKIYFDYNDKNRVTITVENGNTIEKKIQYNKRKVTGITSEEYLLESMVDLSDKSVTYETKYGYKNEQAAVKVVGREDDNYKNFAPYAVLETIVYPTGSTTKYECKEFPKYFGKYGFMYTFRVEKRYETFDSKNYNVRQYNYNNEFKVDSISGKIAYDGYEEGQNFYFPDKESGEFYDGCKFKLETEVIGYDNEKVKNKVLYNYNVRNMITNVVDEGDNHKVVKTNKEYRELDELYRLKKKINKVVTEVYKNNKDDRTPLKMVEEFEYDKYGDLVNYWGVQASRDLDNNLINRDNDQHKVSYEYNDKYHYITTKEYKQNDNRTIIEKYIPYGDEKNIQYAEIYQKSNYGSEKLKSRVKYEYDQYGNVKRETKYKVSSTGSSSEYSVTEFSYIDTKRPQFNGANLIKTTIKNLRDADNESLGDIENSYEYDYFGRVEKETDGEGNPISYEYDKFGKIKEIKNADSSVRKYDYDYIKNTVTVTDEEGCSFEFDYDPLGNLKYEKDLQSGTLLKEYEYDSNQRIRIETINNGYQKTNLEYKYCDNGRLERRTAYNKDNIKEKYYEEEFEYEDLYIDEGKPYSKVRKIVKGDENSEDIVTDTLTDKTGRVVKVIIDPDGKNAVTTFKYDYVGNKIEGTSPRAYHEGWSKLNTTSFQYDYAGRLLNRTDIEGNYSTTEYDSLGRITAKTDIEGNKRRNGNQSIKEYSITYEYDRAGRVIKEKIPFEIKNSKVYCGIKKYYYNKNGNLIRAKVTRNKVGEDEKYNEISYEYNNRNQLVKVITYNKDGNPENHTQYYYDELGNKIRQYTGLSSPLTIHGPDSVSANGDNEYTVTKYEYDDLGYLKKVIDSREQEINYTNDFMGNVRSIKDRNNNNITMNYDGLGRIISRTVVTPDGSGNVNSAFSYTLTGQRKTSYNGDEITEYKYNSFGKIKEEQIGAEKKIYSYDVNGNRTGFNVKINNIGKTNITYEYNNLNRLEKVLKDGTEIASYTYYDGGNRQTLEYANGNTVKYKYNLAGKLTELINTNGKQVLSKYDYTYYLDGNRASEAEEKILQDNRTRYFTYDGLGRIEEENEETEEPLKYTYDDSNNRKTMKVPKKWEQLGTDIKEVTYNYNGLNQLTETVNENGTAQYKYNADGLRTEKTVNGSKIKYIYDGSNIIAETDSNNRIEAEYIRGINLIAREDNNTRLYYLYNGHGDVVQLTDENGNVVKSYSYDGFGNENDIKENDTNPFRYGGEYYDSETGLYYLRARYYDPKTGRFTTEDSYWGESNDPLSLNIYTYCSNNPIAFADPNGHTPQPVCGDPSDYHGKTQEYYYLSQMSKNPENMKWVSSRLFEVEYEANAFEKGVSFIVGFIPVVGDVKDLQEALTGIDFATMEKLTIGERVISGICVVIPVVNGKVMRKLDDIKIIDGAACFTADTKIQTKDGYKYIKDIKIDDEVYAQNTKTGQKGLKKVKNVFINETSTLIHLKVNNTVIKTTEDHPFWVKGEGWIAAGELTLDDELIDYDGSIIKIQGITIEELDGPMTVYNFEVEDWHTYFASENGVLVHNDCMIGDVVEGAGNLTGSLDNLTKAERVVVDDLLARGRNVEIIPRSNIQGVKTPDFLVNGVRTELKTLSGTSLNTPVSKIQKAFKQGAETVIIDARNVGINSSQAETVLNRVSGVYKGNLPGNVEIWTVDGIFGR